MESESSTSHDPYLWLEDVGGSAALAFVEQQNARARERLDGDPRFGGFASRLSAILSSQDRIPGFKCRGGFVFNLWTDAQNKRGLWRRATKADFVASQGNPQWEILLDVDALSVAEGESWVFQGADFPPGDTSRVLLWLSRGGKDASLVREFDVEKKEFVLDGFSLPEGKHRALFKDRDTVLVAVDDGPGSVTASGYPAVVRLWKRGERWQDGVEVLRAGPNDMVVSPWSLEHADRKIFFASRALDFFHRETCRIFDDGTTERIDVPTDCSIFAFHEGSLFVHLRSEWQADGQTFPASSLVELPLASGAQPRLFRVSRPGVSFQGGFSTSSALVLQYLEEVQSRLVCLRKEGAGWREEALPVPPFATASVWAREAQSDEFFLRVETFTEPPRLFRMDVEGRCSSFLSMAPKFAADALMVEQCHATSRDGTRIPYFLVRGKDMAWDGSNRTLLAAYGGFEISRTPYYVSSEGACWLEMGGVFVVANIRGGGEFGPEWHRAALQENRQRAFDDLIAVAEDLVARKITSPQKLAIKGGSNGGLLVGAVMTQRPELLGAVLCQVPLLDMMRYHKLLAGHSWMAEYGNPDETSSAAAQAIARYSPYQKVAADVKYPKIFLRTSTRDDRVHPGHARKMAAKMIDQGHDVVYFENTEGGHAGAADFEQTARMQAMDYIFLYQALS